MSDPAAVVTGLVSQANPFASIAPVLDSATKTLVPYVGLLSSQTTGLIVGDGALAFYMTLMFMVSLIVIVISDRIGLTRNLRFTSLAAHEALLRVVRAIITMGLFFVGRRIGQSGGSFESGYNAASGFIQTTTVTWLLQKIIEWFSDVGQSGFVQASDTFAPVIDANSFLQTITQVIYDYLKLYNDLVLNSLVGAGGGNTIGLLTPGTVTGDKSTGAATLGRVKTLFQLYRYRGVSATTQLEGGSIWYYSPLYAGLFIGLM
jgi:hypothetical protein